MPQFCHHGHEVVFVEESSNDRVCQLCGSVTNIRPAHDTSGSIDATIDSNSRAGEVGANPGVNISASEPEQGDSPASMLVTLDQSEYERIGSGTQRSGQGRFTREIEDRSIRREVGKSAQVHFDPPELEGYTVIGELGRGGMGVVYRAHAETLGRDVALKTLQSMSPAGLHRFKQEFRALADIAHPNLASLYELLSDGKTWCFTMEILEGVEFLEYVWSGFARLKSDSRQEDVASAENGTRLTPKRLERLENALRQLAVGLNALHQAGMLHSDIKPSNVLVTKEGRLVLLDFGLVAQMQRSVAPGDSRTIQGTPRYMSPEQADAAELTAASDWYSVGVMLYEVLTGRLPFGGSTVEILSRKQIEQPVHPRQLAPCNPPHLIDLCMALLERDPRSRPTAAQILQAIGATDLADELLLASRSASVRSIELVGRERHLALLERSFAEVSQGNTLSVFVQGKSGMGKSVLVRRFLDDIKQSNRAVVLEGRCYEQESVPFKALDSLIDSLALYLETLTEDIVQGLMPRDRLALTRVFPVLGRVPEAANATYPTIENADQQELRQRAMNALRELLQRFAIREPLVLYVDDLQWGDVDSAGLLADLVRPPDAPRMLLLGSYRSEGADRSSCLQALTEAYQKGQHLPRRENLSVESLTGKEATELALILLGRDDEQSRFYANKIAQESAGWPFFVWELVQHVQDDPEIADQSLELDEVIWSRVKRLPPDAARLLQLVAIAGRPMPSFEIYKALDAVANGPSLLAQLRTNSFVRTTESEYEEASIETYHDRIRESVLNHLDQATIRDHNLKLALMIEEISGLKVEELLAHINKTADFDEPTERYILEKHQWQRVFDLAYYFDAAGESERAFPFALVAAEQANKQHALEVAEQQYRIAVRGAEATTAPMKFRVAEGLGEVLATRGQYEQAAEQLLVAVSLVKSNVTLARIEGKLGYILFKKGDMAGAQEHFEEALIELGNPPPRNALTQSAALLKEVAVQLLHTYLPSRFMERRKLGTEHCRMDLFRARLYDGLGYAYWFKKGPLQTLWTHLRHMNLAERYPATQELGRAYAMHGVIITAIPLANRGAAYADKSFHIHRELGDLQGQGKARSFQTFSLLAAGRFREGVECGREAVRLLEQAGDVWEANMARIILSQPLYFLGDLRASHLEVKQAYEIGKQTGDHSAVAIALYFWVPSAPHAVPAGVIEDELKMSREDPLSSAAVVQARGLELLLREDQPRQAAVVIQESLDVARRRGLRNPCIFSGVTWKATALRMVAEREPEGPARVRALKEAKKAVRDALKITKKYLACRSQALRESALIAVLQRQEKRASHQFEESLRVAEAQEAKYDLAKTQLARGQAGQTFNWPNAKNEIEEAQAALARLEDFSIEAEDSAESSA